MTKFTEGRERMLRYLYGWRMFVRAVYMARTKRRGAGPMRWSYALKMGAGYRYLVDGQFCTPRRWPRYLGQLDR